MNPVGILLDSLRLPLPRAIETASSLGFDGVQFYATRGETHVSTLRGARLAEIQQRLRDANLEVAALCGDFGGHGFEYASANATRVDDTKRVIECALELGSRVVSTHVGVIPRHARDPRRTAIAKACAEIGRFAAEHGAVLAIETGPEPAVDLCRFLEDLDMPNGISVNFDPANLVMVHRENIPAAVACLAPYIAHTHVKDGINLQPVDPELLYGCFAGDPCPGFRPETYIRETRVGEGDVPWPAYLSALRNAEYEGYLTVEREAGNDRCGDARSALLHVRRWLRETAKKEKGHE